MPVFLHGLSLQYYRGIGPKQQRMGPFKDFNFFIGPNNAGKSTVLNFINDHIPFERENGFTDIIKHPLNQYRGTKTGGIAVEIGLTRQYFVTCALGTIPSDSPGDRISTMKRILNKLGQPDGVWLTPVSPSPSRNIAYTIPYNKKDLAGATSNNEWYVLWTSLTKQGDGNIFQHWIPEVINSIISAQKIHFPTTALIPTLREIGPKDQDMFDFSGAGLIDRLAQIQNPDLGELEEKNLFNMINAFLQEVTGKSDSRIEIPHSREHVLVHMDNKVLPLSSLGTGIHEVIMIAAFCTFSEKKIVCIEEPEIHLHPVLQRKLIRYLQENTDNQYFIATHSAAFIDTPDAAIFHVSNDGSQTYIRNATIDKDKLGICRDLGYKASDILQANAVIWVEGPSDRIYINHWIQAFDTDLIEGIHYSIMYYGGRLLSHLNADWEAVEDLIGLRTINQNLAVVIDSDKSSAQSPINSTKKRIKDELADSVVWITKGREIENYVKHEDLQAAVKAVHPKKYKSPSAEGSYDHALYYERTTGKSGSQDKIEKSIDKVKVARKVCEQPANLDILDLKERIESLVQMIKQANQ